MNSSCPARPPIVYREHLLHDPDEFEEAVSGTKLIADFLTPGHLATRVEQFQTPNWSFDFQEAHVKARVHASMPPGWVALGLTRSAAPSTWYGSKVTQGTLLCNPPGEPIDGYFTPGFSCLTICFPSDLWERGQILAGVEDTNFDQFAAMQLPTASYLRIEQQLLALQKDLRSVCAETNHYLGVSHHAADFVIHMAASAWESAMNKPRVPDSYRNRIRLAHRAEEWLRIHLPDKIQVTDLSLKLRVSRRELEYAFKLAFDCGPQEYLNKLRLNAIYRALRCAAPFAKSVTNVALDHGITHLGRFSTYYYKLFGEKPSATLRKS